MSPGALTTVTGRGPRLPKYAVSLPAITNRNRCPASYRCTMPGRSTVKGRVTSGTRTGATRRFTSVWVPSGATSYTLAKRTSRSAASPLSWTRSVAGEWTLRVALGAPTTSSGAVSGVLVQPR